MSIEFNEDIITGPIISPGYAPQDAGEIGLRPKLLADYTGQEKAKGNLGMAQAALQELGYSAAEISGALKGADPNATTEELIRHALRAMVMKN